MIKKFLKDYKYYIIPLIIIALLTIFLIFVSGGPQKGAFKYQIF